MGVESDHTWPQEIECFCLGMQNFDFAQTYSILIKFLLYFFAQFSPQIPSNLPKNFCKGI